MCGSHQKKGFEGLVSCGRRGKKGMSEEEEKSVKNRKK
jgi:hypothetical protein